MYPGKTPCVFPDFHSAESSPVCGKTVVGEGEGERKRHSMNMAMMVTIGLVSWKIIRLW
jgi:hypothetical protein